MHLSKNPKMPNQYDILLKNLHVFPGYTIELDQKGKKSFYNEEDSTIIMDFTIRVRNNKNDSLEYAATVSIYR